MLRLISLLIMAFFGLVAAILFAPIPGKTFFNKLSKLPKKTRNLIDDVLEICESAMKFSGIIASEIGSKLSKLMQISKEKTHEIRNRMRESGKRESDDPRDLLGMR